MSHAGPSLPTGTILAKDNNSLFELRRFIEILDRENVYYKYLNVYQQSNIILNSGVCFNLCLAWVNARGADMQENLEVLLRPCEKDVIRRQNAFSHELGELSIAHNLKIWLLYVGEQFFHPISNHKKIHPDAIKISTKNFEALKVSIEKNKYTIPPELLNYLEETIKILETYQTRETIIHSQQLIDVITVLMTKIKVYVQQHNTQIEFKKLLSKYAREYKVTMGDDTNSMLKLTITKSNIKEISELLKKMAPTVTHRFNTFWILIMGESGGGHAIAFCRGTEVNERDCLRIFDPNFGELLGNEDTLYAIIQ